MKIGEFELKSNLILAPMAGVSDRPFRELCRRYGAGLAVSEMISSDASLWGTEKTVRRLDHNGEEAPISVQILGTDPAEMATAARANLAHGAQIIDINMGCPVKKVCKVAAGSALLKDEVLVGRICAAVVEAARPAPVTLKIRTGWCRESKNAVAIAHIAEDSGIAALAVHGRTRACGYSGEVDYGIIKSVKVEVGIPVIANGDIDSAEKARWVLDYTGVDAIMIGRAAQGRPWIFSDLAAFLTTGSHLDEPSRSEIGAIVVDHLDRLYQFYGTGKGIRIARKHIAWYARSVPGAAAFRQRAVRAETAREQIALVRQFFGQGDNRLENTDEETHY